MQKHLRNTFLAGVLGAVPLAVTAFVIWWVDHQTRAISEVVFKRPIPGVGVLIALAAIYLVGLLITSLIGKAVLRILDRVLRKIPVLRELYAAWKQVLITPGGTEGIYAKVALIPDESGQALLMGFTSGQPVEGDPSTLCVFVPNSPNPVVGRLYFVKRAKCRLVDMSTEDAFKMLLSSGNYVPAALGTVTGDL
jgi:uncharacterized membrane protein